MALEIIEATQKILEQVEGLTQKRFKFAERDDLTSFAKIKPARKNMPNHIMFYRKIHDEIINHLIAHECGHIIRIFEAPESKRVAPFADKTHYEIAMGQVKGEIKRIYTLIPKSQVDQLSNIWISGLVSQLINGPPDLMIEKWLYDDYPELRNYQFVSIKRQWKDAIAALNKNVKTLTPKKIYISSNVMNYAYFKIIGSYINYNFLAPFSSTIFSKQGENLVKLTVRNYKDNFEGDVEKINEWASFLNLSNWFGWRPFEDVPDNYEEMI